MDIKLYATILLFARMVSMVLMGLVLRRQLQLLRAPFNKEQLKALKIFVDKEIRRYRMILFVLALAIFAGNIIPAVIDFLTIIEVITRSAKVINGASLAYTLAWTITSLLMAILIFWLYRMSHTVDETHEESEHLLVNDDVPHK